MRPQARDTDPKIEEMKFERLRQMSGEDRLRMAFEDIQFIRDMQPAEIRREHPDADEREVEFRLASRWCDAKLLKQGFGWDVEEQGY